MVRTPNLNSTGFYAKLVGLYPASYRQHYAQPMVQTFDDMLEAEPSKTGRLIIWARALWDIPSSALKEHLTNGKGIVMSRTLKMILAGIVAVLLIANGASFWFGILHGRGAVGIEKVTPVELADAMQQDHFYSSYGEAALLFSGVVTSTRQKDGVTIATFKTGTAYALECQFPNAEVKAGDMVSVAAPGGSAERLPHGVLLHNCVKN